MIIDLKQHPNEIVDADFAIIGGGTVGLITALELASKLPEKQIVVIESGYKFSEQSEIFEVNFKHSNYLGAIKGRFRGLGGTSARWGGAMIPMQPADWKDLDLGFELTDLYRHIERLEQIFGLPPGDYSASIEDQFLGSPYTARLGKWPAFKNRNTYHIFKSRIRKLSNLKVYVNSHVTSFTQNSESDTQTILALSENKNKLLVSTRNIILCAGAIESTRLALIYTENLGIEKPEGLGRFFSDHLAISVGHLRVADKIKQRVFNEAFSFRFEKNGTFRNIRFELNNDERDQLPPHYVHFTWKPADNGGFSTLRDIYQQLQTGKPPSLGKIMKLIHHLPWLFKAIYWRIFKKRVLFDEDASLHLDVLLEQHPSTENMITIDKSSNTNPFGQHKLAIDWKISQRDITNLNKIIKRLEAIWPSSKIGEICSFERNDKHMIRDQLIANGGSFHPTGTTKLGDIAKGGCVNKNLYLYGTDKLQVLSTSIFPTGTGVNPTMMLMLFALRAVDQHVEQHAQRRPQS